MALFKITNILNVDTIEVSGWQWGEFKGKKVKIAGYASKGPDIDAFAKNKLQILLKDKQVELKNVQKADKGNIEGDDIITCSVYLNDINILQYFPELTT